MFSAEHGKKMHKIQREAIPLHEAHMNMHCHLLTAVVYMGKSAWEKIPAKAKQLLWPQSSWGLVNTSRSLWFSFRSALFPIFIKYQGKQNKTKNKRTQMSLAALCAVVHPLLNQTQFKAISCMSPVTYLIPLHLVLHISVVLHSPSLCTNI